MSSRLSKIVPLVFGSGFCALVYQSTWLREFRLFFGASTAANAAVVGIFMGGLGLGSLILGRRAQAHARPLAFYAKLELLVAASVATTPLLLWLSARIYLALGGTLTLGIGLGSVVRLLLATLILGAPTFFMGGTLPAIARAAVGPGDTNRRALAMLYGMNAVGAVAGIIASTFYLFEVFGNRMTLGGATLLNVVIALISFRVSKRLPKLDQRPPRLLPEGAGNASSGFVLAAAAITGFAFLLMETVWYRMLSPLLGGSAFTFGIILAVALFGVGLGGVLYAFGSSDRRVTLNGFALTCALEAIFIALPYALGDRVALIALLLRPLGALGFSGFVVGWAAVCVLVILPAASIAGMQFPMLIALLGKGGDRVATQTGQACAWNTVGAIVGSLVGGFGLLPAMTAPGVWRAVVVLLALLAGVAAVIEAHQTQRPFRLLPPLVPAAIALCLLTALGPTAFWRHSQIGVGRLSKFTSSKNGIQDLMHLFRRTTMWEADGVESSIAVSKAGALGFFVNGRCDGNLISDAGTQTMIGLIPSILAPRSERALVVGLGTGSTAGWLAAVPSIKRVDVVEFEPAVLRVARESAPMNQHALDNPKLHVVIADAREMLLTSRESYDIIVSEPSNPYRAGIASLFTREYYQAAAQRLSAGGTFAQWVQAYEVDDRTMQTIYATFGAVFRSVETWQTQGGDLLLVGSNELRTYDASEVRDRIKEEPFRSALLKTWHVANLEGFLSHFVANSAFATAIGHTAGADINTDDRTILEFGFARNVDHHSGFQLSAFRRRAHATGADRPEVRGNVEWSQVDTAKLSMLLQFGEPSDPKDTESDELASRVRAYNSFIGGDLTAAWTYWKEKPREPQDLNELLLVAECAANSGVSEAEKYIARLHESLPVEADASLARLLFRQQNYEEATDLLAQVFTRLQSDPWLSRELTQRTLGVANELVAYAATDLPVRELYQSLGKPFSVFNSDEERLAQLLVFGMKLDKERYTENTLSVLEAAEPFVPWQQGFLEVRRSCYATLGHPLLETAERDLRDFRAGEAPRIESLDGAAHSRTAHAGGEEPVTTPRSPSFSEATPRSIRR